MVMPLACLSHLRHSLITGSGILAFFVYSMAFLTSSNLCGLFDES